MPAPSSINPAGSDGRVFHHRRMTWEERKPGLELLRLRHPGAFRTPADVDQYLWNIRMPASCRWAYKSNDKAGSSSVLRFLYEIEFGVPLTVKVSPPNDINEDVVAHYGPMASLFLQPADFPGGVAALLDNGVLRLATVRHPAHRAVSSFTYLCRSQELSSTWFSSERLRLSALTGFDWTRHMYSVDGFERFLDYVAEAHVQAAAGGLPVNTHWVSQQLAIRPDLFQPAIVGRTESLADFCREVATRLDRPLPNPEDIPHTNRQRRQGDASLLTPATRARIARVYAADYEAFGYDP